MLKSVSDGLTTSCIDLGLKMAILTLIYLRIEFFLFDFCVFIESGEVVELILISVSILRDEVASE